MEGFTFSRLFTFNGLLKTSLVDGATPCQDQSVLPDENLQKGPKAKILKNKKDQNVPDFFWVKWHQK